MENCHRGPAILIVENEPQIASYIEEVLHESGFEVVGIAASAEAALSRAATRRPSLALVDVRLAGTIDGIDLACQLRQHFTLSVIFLSGALDGETLKRARAAEPLAILHKPFLPSHVFNALEQAFGTLEITKNEA